MIYDEHDENRNGQKKKWEKQDKNDKIKLFIVYIGLLPDKGITGSIIKEM